MAAPYYESLETQEGWREYLQQLIKKSDKALYRAILAIYNNQTDEERATGSSVEDNGIGFTKWDAGDMTAIAKKVAAGKALTPGEIAKSRNKMVKYWKQLMYISQRNINRRREEEAARIQAEERGRFRNVNDAMVRCMEQGVPCGYGICDECVVGRGVQTCMDSMPVGCCLPGHSDV